MAVFRFIALVLIVLGLMLLGADVVTMLERGAEPQLRSLENIWALFSASGVESFKVWIAEITARAGVRRHCGIPKPPRFCRSRRGRRPFGRRVQRA